MTVIPGAAGMSEVQRGFEVMQRLSKVLPQAADKFMEGKFVMVSAVHHSATANQTESISNQLPANRAEVNAAQKPPAKPQPVQDSVKLNSVRSTNQRGDSK